MEITETLNREMARCGDKLRDRDISNPVIAQFTLIAKELDDKNDRHERLVKLSRDITIESKRVNNVHIPFLVFSFLH